MMTTVRLGDSLSQYVDGVFERYDLDHSNTLTLNEAAIFFNDLLGSRGKHQKMTIDQVRRTLRSMNASSDVQITKTQLYNALNKINGIPGVLAFDGNQMPQTPQNSNSYQNLPGVVRSNQIPQRNSQLHILANPHTLTNNFAKSQIITPTITHQAPILPFPRQVVQSQPIYTQPALFGRPLSLSPPALPLVRPQSVGRLIGAPFVPQRPIVTAQRASGFGGIHLGTNNFAPFIGNQYRRF